MVPLDFTHKNENKKNNKYKPQAAGGAVTPIGCCNPIWATRR